MTKEESVKIKSKILEKEGSVAIGNVSIPEVLWLSDVLEIINSFVDGEDKDDIRH